MAERITSGSDTIDAGRLDAETVGLDPSLVLPDVSELPNPEAFSTIVNVVLQPWAIESEETISDALRAFFAEELGHLSSMNTGQLAWSVAELVVARQSEVIASGDGAAAEGMLAVADLARMFEHVFIAQGGVELTGTPA